MSNQKESFKVTTTKYTDHPMCPYCGYEYADIKINDTEEDCGTFTHCVRCRQQFWCKEETIVVFTSRKRGEL